MSDDSPDSALAVREAGGKGKGVYALQAFSPGSLILRFEGPRLYASEVADYSRVIQLDAETYLGPSGRVDDFVNHSCEPNGAVLTVENGLALFAIRKIAEGQEITFDYSTCMLDEPPLEPCACGAQSCRRIVVPFPELPPAVRRRYVRAGAVPDYAAAQDARERPNR
jgi:SET domain-containing protein